MAKDIHPPELARLLDYAERPRTQDWSLRAALTRYAQPQPQRVGDLLEVVRWVDFAVKPHLADIERRGDELWQAVASGDAARSPDLVVGLLGAMADLDRVGDVLAVWASDPSATERPDAAVDEAIGTVARRLVELRAPREQRQRPPRSRG